MTGYLTQTLGKWMVKHGDQGNEKFYPLCPQSEEWSKKDETKKFIKEGIEVIFDFVVKGEYCEIKKTMIKNHFAKVKRVEHEGL